MKSRVYSVSRRARKHQARSASSNFEAKNIHTPNSPIFESDIHRHFSLKNEPEKNTSAL